MIEGNHKDTVEIVQKAPSRPGVYIMKDDKGVVLYVGKAKNLKSRLKAYLHRTDRRFTVPFLMARLTQVEYIVTETEKEALILENNLIKKHRPRYNVYFRDDKNYFSLRLNWPKEQFPRFQLVRQIKNDGARYFGPYPSSNAAKETLEFLQSIFPLRTCSDRQLKGHTRPCLEYQIKRCAAPCAGLISEEAYTQMVKDSIAFLEGRAKKLLKELNLRMREEAEKLNFEEAARLRDRIEAIKRTIEKQRIVSPKFGDLDVFGVYRENDQTSLCVLMVRKGKLLEKRSLPLITLPIPTEEIISSLICQYYAKDVPVPETVLVPLPMEEISVLEEYLTEKANHLIKIRYPKSGYGRDLLSLANSNAEQNFREVREKREEDELILRQMKDFLGLKNVPRRIECFDVSHLGGRYAVGAMVVFQDGKPRKEDYRHFRIRTVETVDDYAMLREILTRRYSKRESLPDLVVMDGGKGQLGVAEALFRDLGIGGVDLLGMAKEGRAEPEDHVYLPKRKEAVLLSRRPKLLYLLQQVRDEAHRFALSYHHKVKTKRDFHSVLDEIPGLGERKKRALLKHFSSLAQIKQVSPEELQQVKGIGPKLSVKIKAYLSKEPLPS